VSEAYKVSLSGRNQERFEEIRNQAKLNGRYKDYYLAYKWTMEELSRTPMEFGESREFDPGSGLYIRVAIVGILCVKFAVHEESRQVFIGRIHATF
jgi:hypothetical protein